MQSHQRKRHTALTRSNIIDVASRLYMDQGFYGVTIRQVAKAAGTTIGGVYFHFASKDELIGAVLSTTLDSISGHVRSAVGSLPHAANPGQRIRAAIEAHMTAVVRHGEYTMTTRHVLSLIDPEIARAYQMEQAIYIAYWQQLIADAQHARLIRPDINPVMLMFFLFGALTFTPEWYEPRRSSLAAVADEFYRYLFESLTPEGRTTRKEHA